MSSKIKETSKVEGYNKKSSSSTGYKKPKDIQKTDDVSVRKTSPRTTESPFENDFVQEEIDVRIRSGTRFGFENDFETSEIERPVVKKGLKNIHGNSKNGKLFESEFSKEIKKQNFREAKSFQSSQKFFFEDDFSPTEKIEDDTGISSIKEESVNEEEDSFSTNEFESSNRKKILSKRLSNNIRGELNLKKSDSVNIFARENDPFDDDFFCGKDNSEVRNVNFGKISPRTTELKWSEEFEDFDIEEGK